MRDGAEDDDDLFDADLRSQRCRVADALQLGPNWTKVPMWKIVIDTLLSIRRNDGKASFYREIGRIVSSEER